MLTPNISDALYKRHTHESLAQARSLEYTLNGLDLYTGRRQEEGITIDSLSSPDLDDGLSLEKLPE